MAFSSQACKWKAVITALF